MLGLLISILSICMFIAGICCGMIIGLFVYIAIEAIQEMKTKGLFKNI